MDEGSSARTVGALGDAGAIAEKGAKEFMLLAKIEQKKDVHQGHRIQTGGMTESFHLFL
jgi:hypothetical protein